MQAACNPPGSCGSGLFGLDFLPFRVLASLQLNATTSATGSFVKAGVHSAATRLVANQYAKQLHAAATNER